MLGRNRVCQSALIEAAFDNLHGTNSFVGTKVSSQGVNRLLVVSMTLLCFSEASVAQDYVNLLEGRNLSRWMKPDGSAVTTGWEFEADGVLHLAGKGGHIVTREQYGDFELWFEFKIAEKGNSGLKYRVRQYGKSWLGLEYQVLDDSAFPKLTRDHHTASLYDLVTPLPAVTRLNADGEFNIGKIRVQNQRVQHWVNGQLMIDTALTGETWQSYVAASKFNKHAGFGENRIGHLMLTDHKTEVWYRNVFIRRLESTCCDCSF